MESTQNNHEQEVDTLREDCGPSLTLINLFSEPVEQRVFSKILKATGQPTDSKIWNLSSKYFNAEINLHSIDVPVTDDAQVDVKSIVKRLQQVKTEALIYYVQGTLNLASVSKQA